MEFNLSTPALLFSAISLFMLAFTNRFLSLATLIRQHVALYEEKKDPNTLAQIHNFYRRLKIIKYTQIFAVLSFLLCVISMFIIFVHDETLAKWFFGASLVSLFVSLLFSLQELFLSIGALKLEIERIKG
ncbi:DUF2721 domain-containing protein [Treponema sp. J25]|uniref:DUF2721 domain-containing protein n=1 Tax=Treponema sp. J25 TaxID=2094121 RepID=UPI001045E59F|nr:DUF2721 domain-containing protein [Treponema sp. J25]MCX7656509.1 DUF2721 domain-containing protein [Treponemataceae bacterium]TCW61660.1 DUF2721 domain-containing protein [Treponema sp. J25]